MNYHLVIIIYIWIIPYSDGEYLGGSLNWYCMRCTNTTNLIRFTYRMTWEKGTGPCGTGCSPKDVQNLGTVPPSLSSLTWKCTHGCGAVKTIHSDVNYKMTSVSYNSSGWEQGENNFITTDLKGTGPFEVTLEGLKWMVPAKNPSGGGKLVTTLDVGIRNDSKYPNASPIAAVQPSVGIQFGCKSVVPFAVEDPDADTLRCRLATKYECGDSCTDLPKYYLDKEKCSITISATSANGYIPDHDYRVTVMAEDYPDYTISMGKEIRSIRRPMSKIPLQLTLRTITDHSPCSLERGHFKDVLPNHKDRFRVSYPGAVKDVEARMFFQAKDINNTEIMLSVPAGMKSVLLPDDNTTGLPHLRDDVVQEYFTMKPSRMTQIADTLLCAWGRSPNGITHGRLCYVAVLFDNNDCHSPNPCKHNGTCMDLYSRHTCKCPHGYKPLDCSYKVTCADFPCKNNGTCVDTGTMYICVCPKGYTGADCEIKLQIAVDNSRSNILPILLGVFGGAALIAAVSTCCCWWFVAAAKRPGSREKKVRPQKLRENGLDTL